MKSILGGKRNILAVAVALTVVLPAAWAQGMDDFKLTKAIPADAFLAVHARDHAGLEFVQKQMERVWAEVEKQRFDRDVKRIFKGMLQQGQPPGTELEGFEEQWQQMHDLWTSVEWSNLGKREFAMGMKLAFPLPEFVMLMRPPEDKLKESFDGLSGVAKTVAELDPNALKLTTEERGNTVIHKIAFADAPFPLGLTLARHDDVILFGFGPTMAEQSLALLRGEGGEALATTARFRGAFKMLPPPTDELVFLDMAKLMGQGRAWAEGVLGMAAGAAPLEGEPGYEDYQKIQALPGKLIDAFDMFEYSASVCTTEGMKSTADAVVVLREDAASHALYPVIAGNKPLSNPLKYVPKTAGDFSATSGVDLLALYKAAVKIIREDVPNGGEMVAQLEALKDAETGPGIDVEQDIVGWIQGGFIRYSVPGPTPYSPAEFVFMLSVRDEVKAREMIARLVGMVEPMLAEQSGSVVDAEIEGTEGFKSVVVPMLAMFGLTKPTVGVKDGWLFLGSSPNMIATSLEVAAGKAADFSQNERFQKEGIPPDGKVTALSFTDLTKLGEELGQMLQMAPMIGMMAPDVMKNPLAQGVLNMVGKVGRVVRKLDFFQSTASRTTFDGKTLVMKTVTTYREPPVVTKPKPTGTEGEAEEAEKAEKTEEPPEE